MAKKLSDLQETADVGAEDIVWIDKKIDGQYRSRRFKILNIFNKLKTIFGVSIVGSGDIDSPKDGKVYGRKDGEWEEVSGGDDGSMNVGNTEVKNGTGGSMFFNNDGTLGEMKSAKYNVDDGSLHLFKLNTNDGIVLGEDFAEIPPGYPPANPLFGIVNKRKADGKKVVIGSWYSEAQAQNLGYDDALLFGYGEYAHSDGTIDVGIDIQNGDVRIFGGQIFIYATPTIQTDTVNFDTNVGYCTLYWSSDGFSLENYAEGWHIKLKPQSASELNLDYNNLSDVVQALKNIGLLSD